MPKDFNDFLNTIDDKSLIREASAYITHALTTDYEEKTMLYNVAIQKCLLNKYHQWLNS